MSVFVNNTKRSAGELLADLTACRQFRHISDDGKKKIICGSYEYMAKLWMGKNAVKHPDPNNPCANCGRPKSKLSPGPGLCFRCYASEAVETRELWVEDVFAEAVSKRGFKCDCCDDICHPQDDDETRFAVIRMLNNIDGAVQPVLCLSCFQDFKTFCSRNFGLRSWRTAHPRDVEKMAIGWFAQKVKVLAEQRMRAA